MDMQSVGMLAGQMATTACVNSLIGAMNAAEQNVDRPSTVAAPAAVFEPQQHLHSQPVYDPRMLLHPTPRIEPRQVLKSDDTEAPAVGGKTKKTSALPLAPLDNTPTSRQPSVSEIEAYSRRYGRATILDVFL